MHVDETDDPAARTLEMLAELTIVNGWQGRVTAGHTANVQVSGPGTLELVAARIMLSAVSTRPTST